MLESSINHIRKISQTEKGQKIDATLIYDVLKKEIAQNKGTKTIANEPSDSLAIGFIESILKNPDVENIRNFCYENNLTTKNVWEKLGEFNEMMSFNNKPESEISLEDVHKRISSYEQSILLDQNLNEEEKQTLLILSAIAKESSAFWKDRYDKGEFTNAKRVDRVGWLVIAAADAASIAVPWFAVAASLTFWAGVGLAN
jgi:hypothetical protein